MAGVLSLHVLNALYRIINELLNKQISVGALFGNRLEVWFLNVWQWITNCLVQFWDDCDHVSNDVKSSKKNKDLEDR